MRALLQRVDRAAVHIDGQTVGQIDRGLLILLGIGQSDSVEHLRTVAEKCVNLRIFEDEQGKMNRRLLDIGGKALVVSQFTLYGDTRKGRRPGFSDAAPPDRARALYEQFIAELEALGVPAQTGVFGAHMHVELVNNGPVTLMVEYP